MSHNVNDKVFYKGHEAIITGAINRNERPQYFVHVNGVSALIEATDPDLLSVKQKEALDRLKEQKDQAVKDSK